MEYKTRDIVGKTLFILSILLVVYIVFSPLTKNFTHIDEFWTVGVLNLPLSQFIPIINSDVHPPLYYIVLKIVFKALSIFGIQYNNIFLLKFTSILPLGLIFIIFGTKIRKEYNWLTVGLFTLTLCTFHMFALQFITIRMYSWGLFFLLMSFVYFKEILLDSNRKAWIFFTIFSVLVAYTQYFIFITSVLLYAILFIHILKNNKPKFKLKIELKKWCLSVISLIILYLPWLFIFLNQLNNQQHVSEPIWPSLNTLINYLTYYTGVETGLNLETLMFKIFAFALLILIVYIFIKEYKKEKSIENYYIGVGLILFYLTLIFGIIIISTSFNLFTIRYLAPVGAIFWFSFCILLGKIKNNKLLIISLIAIGIISLAGISQTMEVADFRFNTADDAINSLNHMNNNDSIIVYTQKMHYINFHGYLNETKEYKSEFYMPYKDKNLHTIKNLTKLYERYPNKDVYIIKSVDYSVANDFSDVIVDNNTYERYGNYSTIWFIHHVK